MIYKNYQKKIKLNQNGDFQQLPVGLEVTFRSIRTKSFAQYAHSIIELTVASICSTMEKHKVRQRFSHTKFT